MPAPPDWHVKYAAAPAWNTHVGFKQPISRTVDGPDGVAGLVPGAATAPLPVVPLPVGFFGAGGVAHATSATIKINERTPRL